MREVIGAALALLGHLGHLGHLGMRNRIGGTPPTRAGYAALGAMTFGIRTRGPMWNASFLTLR